MAEQGGAFSELASGVVPTTFTATGLTSGVYYEFRVESRNSYNYSAFSAVLTLLAAYKPDAPLSITTSVLGN